MINFFRRVKKLSPLDGYNRWATSYHAETNPIKDASDEFITNNLVALKNSRVLDAGCGTGKLCSVALDKGASYVKGIDLSPVMIEEARRNCPRAEFECADLSTVTFEKYDVVICGLVLGHIEDVGPVLRKMIGALNPGGHIILTDFHPYQTLANAKRTFKDNGKTFEISHSLHQLDEYFSLLKDSGLQIVSFREPLFQGHPVIFGIHGVAA